MTVLIIAEKPSAAKNFARALGGASGTFEGTPYKIVAARGHLFELKDPKDMVPPELKERISAWDLAYLPWDWTKFTWGFDRRGDYTDVIRDIKAAASECDEICAAGDLDPSGEGFGIDTEIIAEGNLLAGGKKLTRMYFIDETEENVRCAFRERVEIPDWTRNDEYLKYWTRTRWDMLSMQFSRIATKVAGSREVVREGRLKSAMTKLVGDQLEKYNAYEKVPFYQNRFKDERGVIYTCEEEPKYPRKEDVPQVYSQAHVVAEEPKPGHTAPPKLLDLSSLSAMLAPDGISPDTVLKRVQDMYEASIVSYPRTEDKFISHEQFQEMLPLVDKIAAIVGVDKSVLSIREPRKTHVKDGGSHGANRPGKVVPASLAELDAKFGAYASRIYETLARNFLAMFAPDCEYEVYNGYLQEYPTFKGKAQRITYPGWRAVFDDGEEQEKLQSGLGTLADPYVHEGFPPRAQRPTVKWLMKQLANAAGGVGVGTGATRTSTLTEITKGKTALLTEKKGVLGLTDTGYTSWLLLHNTHIGDVETTRLLDEDMKAVSRGEKTDAEVLGAVADMVRHDMEVMSANAKAARESGKLKTLSTDVYYEGVWQGKNVKFKQAFAGCFVSDDDCARLCAGEVVGPFEFKNKQGYRFSRRVVLAEQEYNGTTFVGMTFVQEDDDSRYKGTWREQEVSFKRDVCGRTLSEEECEKLCAGETLVFNDLTSKEGKVFSAGVVISEGEYKGSKMIRPTLDFNAAARDDKNYYTGVWSGREVSFRRVYSGHEFSDVECEKLCAGETLVFLDLKKKDGNGTYAAGLYLREYDAGGKISVRVECNFDIVRKNNTADYYTGVWRGREVTFGRKLAGYVFSDAECEKMCACEPLTIDSFVSSKTGNAFSAGVILADEEYKGRKSVRPKLVFADKK